MPTADLFISMARRYYRRRTVVVRPKKKWASNLSQGNFNSDTTTAVLVANQAQTETPTPTILKAGNFKIQGDLYLNSGTQPAQLPRYNVYVYYLPEGVTMTTADVATKHPEWIMCWKQLDIGGFSTSAGAIVNGQAFSFSSRLKRNLNSGDRILIGVAGSVASGLAWAVNYTCQFWTCAN